jgi:hypothetical protein
VGIGSDDSLDLEVLEPRASVSDGTSTAPIQPRGVSWPRRALVIGGAVVLGALVVSEIATLIRVHDLDRRLDRLQRAPAHAKPGITAAATHVSQFCLSYPLVGRLTIVPAREDGTSLDDSGEIRGDIAGFPVNRNVSVELWSATTALGRTLCVAHKRTWR